MEGLPRRKEYLETFFGSHAPPKNGQYLPQEPFRKTDSNINTLRLCSTHCQANNPAPHKAGTKISSKNYNMRQVR